MGHVSTLERLDPRPEPVRTTRVYRIVPDLTLRLIFAALLGIASLQLTTLAVLAWATCVFGCGR